MNTWTSLPALLFAGLCFFLALTVKTVPEKKTGTLASLLKAYARLEHSAAVACAMDLTTQAEEAYPQYTGLAFYKDGQQDPPLIVPVGPGCPLSTLEDATGTPQQEKKFVAFWRKP